MNQKTTPSSVVFILGIMPRSGTNFLANLISLHPDCEKSVIAEDFLLQEAGHLLNYGASFRKLWDFEKEAAGLPGYKEFLMENLGKGCVEFLLETTKREHQKTKMLLTLPVSKKLLVTKTPQIKNIASFYKFFPNEKLIIIVRDGRTLVESIVKSFDLNKEISIKKWVKAAQTIMSFEEKQREKNYLIVKYEELHANTETEMHKILSLLELDIEKYNFKSALNLPVMGSCEFKRGGGDVHWYPVKKTEDFKPLERSESWGRAQHERFNRLAKNELLYFGYEPKDFAHNKIAWKLWNHIMDFRQWVKSRGRKAFHWDRLKRSQKIS